MKNVQEIVDEILKMILKAALSRCGYSEQDITIKKYDQDWVIFEYQGQTICLPTSVIFSGGDN